MKVLYFYLLVCSLNACKTSKPTQTIWNTRAFNLFETTDTINLQVTYFSKNSAYCYTEAIPYALLVGRTKNPSALTIPKTITVLAICDNNNYLIGQDIKVVPTEDPTTKTTLKPVYMMKDTVIDKIKYKWLIGSEHPAIWGRVL